MATLQARYTGECAACGGAIRVGDMIEYQRGTPTRHAGCRAGRVLRTAAPAAARRAAPAARKTPSAGEQLVSRRSTGRGDRYSIGQVVRVRGESPEWHVVVSEWIEAPHEDAGHYDWRCVAIVRPATETEASQAAARRAARDARKALAATLAAARGERVAAAMPGDAAVLVPRDESRSVATGERVALVDGAVLYERAGDPDRIDSWYLYTVRLTDAAIVEAVRGYLAAVAS